MTHLHSGSSVTNNAMLRHTLALKLKHGVIQCKLMDLLVKISLLDFSALY